MTSITSKRKTRRFEATLENLEKLKELFPLAFTKKGVPVTPLKIGVNEDLNNEVERLELGMTKTDVQSVLSFWCSRGFYQKAIIRSTHRIDLKGNPVQEINEADREVAKTRLAAIKARQFRQEANFSPEEAGSTPAVTSAPQ